MEGLPINITDLVIIAVVLLSAIFAFVRGFVHEMLAAGAWVGAGLATLYGLPAVQPYFEQLIPNRLFAGIAAGVAIFVMVLIALSVLTHWLARRVRESSLGAVDRSLGLLFGVARGAFLVCLAWIALLWALPREDHPGWITEARALPLVERGAGILLTALPPSRRPDLSGQAEVLPDASLPQLDKLVRPDIVGSGEGSGSSPEGAAKESGPDGRSGYKDAERKDLQRLIDSSQ